MVTMMKMLKRADILLIIILLFLSLLPLLFLPDSQASAVHADITINGQLWRRVPLSAHKGHETITVKTPDGHYNTITIDDDTIAVQEADCPDRICIQQGKAKKPGDIIVCLPHKLLIEIKGCTSESTSMVLPAR